MQVPLGDKLVDYAPAFRLLLLTRNPAPDLSPDAAALVAEVNFTVTASGLEAQLLGLAPFPVVHLFTIRLSRDAPIHIQ